MATPEMDLPDPATWPLQIFIFVRWNPKPPPDPSTVASSKDLKYYLRIMRGPHWRLTVPLCVNGATDQDVEVLETALAYMETAVCTLWFYPMDVWTPTRVFIIAVHAWARCDRRLQRYDWEGMRDLIPHVTPYLRNGPILNMLPAIAGLARLYKEFFPMEIFHYRKMYYREHVIAVGRLFKIPVWTDAGIQCDGDDTHDKCTSTWKKGDERNDGRMLVDDYDSDVHSAEDPREKTSIYVTARTLPPLRSPGILLQIPLPTTPSS
ncbi:hypothetical protein GSI_03096 [Ganoderma sinense ZZ0214-1]|uniref:Uncharacterized protein n=1 Tax=Ganoderma sinense ZZ0214-1 TaxID=1077348 RepID=A0A2G8SKM8_9APHY|nr:hypothetical protein GSI_03096 [Ganoderma sinense ZZ0214-1]